jgi:HlyD family secretion protein
MIRKIFFPVVAVIILTTAIAYYKAVSGPRGLVLTGIVTTHEVIVSSQIAGQLSRLLVKEGDSVKAGQLLAVIEPDELRATQAYYASSQKNVSAQVEAAEAELKFQEAQTRDQVRQAEASLAASQAQQAEAAANLELARLEFERTEALFKQTVASAQARDQARATYEAAQARLESLRKQVAAQQAALALARSTVDQISVRRSQLVAGRHQLNAAGAQKLGAEVRLGYTEIQAPIPATVAVLAAREGEVVNPAQAIVSLVNPDDLWVRADVEETYIDRIRMGDRMTVRLPWGEERVGTVFYRGVVADYATQRDVSRTKRDIKTFEVRLRVDNRDRRLWPGLTAYVVVPPRLTQ